MSTDAELAALLGRTADERLLSGETADGLPPSLGRPVEPEPSAIRAPLVGAGASLTGITLIGGALVFVIGVIEFVVEGIDVGTIVALAIGALLVATHWGWVHVAEASANAIEHRHNAGALTRRGDWLGAIEPYTRWEVRTEVAVDGAINILRTRYEPIPLGADRFTFTATVEGRERHAEDEPGAIVAERAETERRRAAADTERERERYAVAATTYAAELSHRTGEDRDLAARRAASQALSDQINANLSDSPLAE